MKKISTVLLLLCSNCSFAQKGTASINIGPEVVIPTGVANTKTGIGAAVTGVYGVTKLGSVTLSAGVAPFKDKFSSNTFSFIPVKLGYLAMFNGSKMYLHGETGLAFLAGVFRARRQVMFSGGLGYQVKAGSGYIDIAPRFNYVTNNGSNFTWLGIRLAYGFQLSGSKNN